MKRKTSKTVASRNAPVIARIREIKSEHPFWGYRRVWAYLNYHDKMVINKKRVYKLMKENELIVSKQTRLKAKRTPMRSKPRASRPNQMWGIDMTKIKLKEHGWAYIVIVLDWYTKKVVGCHVDMRSKSCDWIKALEQGVQKQFINGVRGSGLKLISDNGCQPTSEYFMKTCNHLGIEQIFTSYCNPKGNADTERMMRTIKEELFWLKEWKSISEVDKALTTWVERYNNEYLHSAHGYKTPVWVEQNYEEKAVA